MKKYFYILAIGVVFLTTSCDGLFNNVSDGLSSDEVISGLKTALNAGTDSSVNILHASDGYYKDAAVKILLPPEGQVLYKYTSQIESVIGSNYLEQMVLRVNRAAEDAATEAKPIFVDAITSMTFEDGLNILNGKTPGIAAFDSIAATTYLKSKTYTALVALFAPKIDVSLNKPILGGVSANEAWKTATGYWNTYIVIFGEAPINGTLGEYTTGKALDGLFYKVGLEEKKIRKDPMKWASDIIQKVFGSVFKG